MAKTIDLKIVTPQKVVYEGAVEEFSVPGVMGPFQVLFNHAPIVSKLEGGELSFTESGGTKQSYFVPGGFLELHQNVGTVLADGAELASQIDLAKAEAEVERIKQRYVDHEEGYTPDLYHADLDAALARLAVAKKA
jgi:F-type H+-transporting ATPase subunit epsilon